MLAIRKILNAKRLANANCALWRTKTQWGVDYWNKVIKELKESDKNVP